MNPIELIAIDHPDTRLREDAFLLEVEPDKDTLYRLTVACILPPQSIDASSEFRILKKRLYSKGKIPQTLRWMFKDAGLIPLQLLELQDSGLTQKPQRILAAVYEFKADGSFVENLVITSGRILSTTYTEFRAHAEFHEAEYLLKLFFAEKPRILDRFKAGRSQDLEDFSNSPEYKLVRGMLDMFNATCSEFAAKSNMATLYILERNNLFMPPQDFPAIFNAPFRKPAGWINLRNLVALLESKPQVFNAQRIINLGLRLEKCQ